jgi:hypothetical protein
MNIYRVTRVVTIPHHGHWKAGAHDVVYLDGWNLVAQLKHEHQNRFTGMKTVKIEQAEIGPFTDVTRDYLEQQPLLPPCAEP